MVKVFTGFKDDYVITFVETETVMDPAELGRPGEKIESINWEATIFDPNSQKEIKGQISRHMSNSSPVAISDSLYSSKTGEEVYTRYQTSDGEFRNKLNEIFGDKETGVYNFDKLRKFINTAKTSNTFLDNKNSVTKGDTIKDKPKNLLVRNSKNSQVPSKSQ